MEVKMEDNLDSTTKLEENQKKHITALLEKLKETELKNISKYKSVKYFDTTFKNTKGDHCTTDIFEVIGDMLYTYSAKSIYHTKVLSVKRKGSLIDVEILIGDFYFGSMMSYKSTITIEL